MAVVAVVAVLATGLAVTQLMAADGAESPEAAVQAFFDAVDQEDALGVLESLSPSERDVLVPSVQALAAQLTELDVAGDDLDLEKVGGLDLRIDGLELRTKGLHPDVAAVEITGGTIATSARFRDLPMGRVLDAAMDEQTGRDLDDQVKGAEPLDFTLATVRGDEGWHVSLLYSLAEAEREHDGAPVPDFGNGIPARGADSPEGAVDAMVEAFNDGDHDRMVELTPPDTMAVLHDYGPGLLIDETDGDDGSARLEDVQLGEPEGSGDTRRLPVQGYRYVEASGGDDTSIVYDGSCITFGLTRNTDGDDPLAGDPDRLCVAGTYEADSVTGFLAEPVPIGPLWFGPGSGNVVVVERDGAWYVDPSRSLISSLLVNLGGMSADQVDLSVEYWAAVLNGDGDAPYGLFGPDAYQDCPGVEPPGEDATFEERRDAGLRCEEAWVDAEGADGDVIHECTTATPEEGVDESCAEGSIGEPADEPLPEDACYDSDDQAEVEACITALGDPEALQDFREIACYDAEEDAAVEACLEGLGDPGALGEFHADACYDSDDDAAIEGCLQDLVDKGELRPEVLFELRCSRVYDDVEGGDMSTADDAFDRCMADATDGGAGVPPPTTR
jgi:hypothetical protein